LGTVFALTRPGALRPGIVIADAESGAAAISDASTARRVATLSSDMTGEELLRVAARIGTAVGVKADAPTAEKQTMARRRSSK